MSTLRALGSVVVLSSALLGCKDLTAPDGGVALVVTPDTVVANRTLVPPGILLNYHIRNVNSYVVAVSPCAPDVERETAPDVWQLVVPADDCFLEPLPAGTWRPLVALLGPLEPGRYRLRTAYALPDSRGFSLTSERSLFGYSNAFVVKDVTRQ
jgi:hypothetical protein